MVVVIDAIVVVIVRRDGAVIVGVAEAAATSVGVVVDVSVGSNVGVAGRGCVAVERSTPLAARVSAMAVGQYSVGTGVTRSARGITAQLLSRMMIVAIGMILVARQATIRKSLIIRQPQC